MKNTIARATQLIEQILQSPSQPLPYLIQCQLVHVQQLLNRLLESNSFKIEWTQLFCQQLNRLMDYNKSLSEEYWIGLTNDLALILEGSNGKQGLNSSWNRFLERINFEKKLEQRKTQFQQSFGERKNLCQIFVEHKKFFHEYLNKCITLHLKIFVQGSVENIDDLLYGVYKLDKTSLSPKDRKRLEEKLKCVEITFDGSNTILNILNFQSSTDDNSYRRINNNQNNFLPSLEQKGMNQEAPQINIANILQLDRWIVILGGPGSAKTTLLRWITRIFAEAAHKDYEEVVLKECNHVPVRIPILIRIGEFAAWLDKHQTKTLMDYIGDHTWFSERYCHSNDKNVLKELINHGHALILLDGLDEIIEIGQRQKIVDLVREFIDEHVRASDFISAFDDTSFDKTMLSYSPDIIETQSPNISSGNQIVVTSRIIGYQLHPLNGPFINHYSLELRYHLEAKMFAQMWVSTVEERILDILSNEGIKLDKGIVETVSSRRNSSVESMFETHSKLLLSNPLFLSLICTSIFHSSSEFHPKTRVEIYTYVVQAALNSWKRHKSNIPEDVLTYFLNNLAIYLHLNSPSGLIDAFDMERLCCMTLKQQCLSDDRTELRKIANELISMLDPNIGIVAERGLQVFGFLHLSFQEYFIARSLVKGPADKVVQRILTCVIDPHSHGSLLLALGWISWKYSFDNYNEFCNLLLAPTEDYTIPLGTLLFFTALNQNDLQKLPSNSIIFTALNNLLYYPSNVIRSTYLILHLSKLPENIITEWMQLYLKDYECLFKFCQSFLMHREKYSHWKSLSPLVCQQLWSFRDRNPSPEFIIDQALRRTMSSIDVNEQIFNKDLSSYFLKNNICTSNIHPLIVSILIVVCGGICLTEKNNIIKIDFSLKRMHHESTISAPIIEYFDNKKESHSVKVQTLIKRYESVLEQSSLSDISANMVDSFIALICLQGLSQPLVYQKYDGYRALPLALERFKRTWFYFKESCDSFQCHDSERFDISFTNSEVETIMNGFFPRADQSHEQCTSFSVACASAWKKFGILNLSNRLNCDVSHNNKNSGFSQYQTDFINIINEKNLDETSKNIHALQILQQESCHFLICVPQSVHQLYHLTTFSSSNSTDSLPPIVFLSYLEDIDIYDLYFVLTMLCPLLQKHKIENYPLLLLLLWEKCSCNGLLDHDIEEFFKKMEAHKLFDTVLKDQTNYLEKFINVEHQRISEAEKMDTCQEKDSRLFAASISLTRLVQARHNSRKYQATKDIGLLSAESKEVCSAIININNPILRIIALSTILNIKNLVIFDEEEKDKFRQEMIDLLLFQLPQLPLLRATFLFVRCYSACQFFPTQFLQMGNIITDKFKENSISGQNQSQGAAYIALKQLNSPNLSHCLSEFAKQTTNLSDLLRFNSTTFFHYFTNTISFDSFNTILLSTMYLAELTFDAQILTMYIRDDPKKNISNMKELEQLWNDSPIYPKTMTYKIAAWIKNNWKILNKQELDQIIEDISDRVMIEKKALSVIEQWLYYRMDKNFSFFALYAALQLIISGLDSPDLTDIINKMLDIDSEFRLKLIVNHLLNSQLANQIIVRQILVILHRDVRRSAQIFIQIDRIEMLELILNLELKRITSNACRSLCTNSFLSMFSGFSKDFQVYLVKHLHDYVNEHSALENAIKHEYIAGIVKWIIENSIWYETEDFLKELYDYIFILLSDPRFHRIQKAIINGINSVFINSKTCKTNVFMQADTIANLGKVLHSWDNYPENVLSAVLLAYGNLIINQRLFKRNFQVPDKTMDILTNLHEKSPSEVISIRAGFCLALAHRSSVTISTILDWIRNKSNMTPKKTYGMLLQLTLYEEIYALYDYEIGESEFFEDTIEKEIIYHLETQCIELMDIFVMDLYNYLCNKHKNNYLFDPEPDYIKIVSKISEKKFDEFRNALQQSSFGEENFKNQLYNYYKNNPQNSKELIEFYTKFGMLTLELLEMLQMIGDDLISNIKLNEDCIKEVADREVIEKLFQLLDLNIHHNKFTIFLPILKSLLIINAVSLLEVHQWFSRINKISSDDDNIWWNNEREVFNWLLNIGGFDGGYLWKVEQIFFNQSDIDEEFQRQIQNVEQRCYDLC